MSWGAIYTQSWWGRAIANDFGDVYSDEVNIKADLFKLALENEYVLSYWHQAIMLYFIQRRKTMFFPEIFPPKIAVFFCGIVSDAQIFLATHIIPQIFPGKKAFILAIFFALRKKYRKYLRYILQNAKINEKDCGIFCRAQKILQKLAQK